MKILQINSSIRADASNSTRLANAITARLSQAHPGAEIQLRDLATDPQPALDGAALSAMFTPTDQQNADQQARLAYDQTSIDQLLAADAIVLGVPMYNFGIPVQLKAWIDAIAKAGITFRYTETGPQGLISGKKVYVALARGGKYWGTPSDSQVPYLKAVLGFLGMSDVQFVYAEGLNMGAETADQAFAQAEQQISNLTV